MTTIEKVIEFSCLGFLCGCFAMAVIYFLWDMITDMIKQFKEPHD
jgi:hypothetical protein